MLVGRFRPEECANTIRRTLAVTEGCLPEILLKDTFTLEEEPARLEE